MLSEKLELNHPNLHIPSTIKTRMDLALGPSGRLFNLIFILARLLI